jgi:ABC-type histidine transport system ATPase subunit
MDYKESYIIGERRNLEKLFGDKCLIVKNYNWWYHWKCLPNVINKCPNSYASWANEIWIILMILYF